MKNLQEEISQRSFLKEYADSLHRSTRQARTIIEIHPKNRQEKPWRSQEGSTKLKQRRQWQYSTTGNTSQRQKITTQLVLSQRGFS